VHQLRIHDARHQAAFLMASAVRSIYEIQLMLGHSDPKVTMRFAHLSAKTLLKAANAGSAIVSRLVAAA
jgi:integrase